MGALAGGVSLARPVSCGVLRSQALALVVTSRAAVIIPDFPAQVDGPGDDFIGLSGYWSRQSWGGIYVVSAGGAVSLKWGRYLFRRICQSRLVADINQLQPARVRVVEAPPSSTIRSTGRLPYRRY